MSAAIVVALGMASATAVAQQEAGAAPAGPGDYGKGDDYGKGGDHGKPGDRWSHGDHDRPMPSQFIEARIAYIKTALQITPQQMQQFNAVADVMRKHAKAMDAKMAAWKAKADGDHATRPDPIAMLEHRQKALTEASADLAETIAAWKPLYATFSDAQKEIAPRVMGGHGGWHHGMGR
jgi:hypothetical protein